MDEPKRYQTGDTRKAIYEFAERTRGTSKAVEVFPVGYNDPAIVQALANNKALAKAGLLDEHGNLRKIIGTLPVTADGCVLGLGGNCYSLHEGDLLECGPVGIRDEDDGCGIIVTLLDVSGFEHEREPQQLFSTREAAERAAKERSDGQ